MKTVKVDPVEGRVVRLPGRNFEAISQAGTSVPLDAHVKRALAAGDLVEHVDKPETPPAEPVSMDVQTSKKSGKASPETQASTN